jgi:hypothetical protein
VAINIVIRTCSIQYNDIINCLHRNTLPPLATNLKNYYCQEIPNRGIILCHGSCVVVIYAIAKAFVSFVVENVLRKK